MYTTLNETGGPDLIHGSVAVRESEFLPQAYVLCTKEEKCAYKIIPEWLAFGIEYGF